ncbi:MAG: hypothetical protein A2Y10_08120 [Planctomycetes bacterium GWF2_41_51]|nr:MAG: hypothetical protein A2Y10_08120 [Planctomycetes bacterium GWF2_41_51]HBG26125.1 hypothetical protein [Phycisphaerales bacterium]
MEILHNIFLQSIVQRFGWTLIHFTWQGTLIAILLAIALRLMRKSSSNVRYTAAFLALAVMAILPLITIRMIKIAVPAANPILLAANNIQPLKMTSQIDTYLPQPKPLTKTSSPPKWSLKDRFIKTAESLLPHLVCFWLAGVFILSIWYLGGWTQLQRLRRQMVSPVSNEITAKLNQLSQVLGIHKVIDIFQSVLVVVPTVIGHFKPVILLPASAITGLSTEQISAILAHELAHIKRCDYLINILQTVIEILGFYHPAVWWVSCKIRQERENCCDDIAVQITGDNINYARALATMEEIRFGSGKLAVAAAGGNLFERIKRLLSDKNSNIEKRSWLPSAIVILLIAGLLIPMTMTLSSCDKQKIEQSGMNAKLNKIDIDTATKDDVIKIFGQPEKYVWGQQVFDKENLPNRYVMIYPDNFHAFIGNNHVVELRFEGPSDYVFDDGLTVDSSLEKAFEVLGGPKEIVEGKNNEFLDNVFYKNIEGRKGYGYYAVPEKNVRIWIADDKVKAIYLRRSNSSAGPNRKLRADELPEGSIIDANGHIVDKLDHPFVNDPQVLGTWQSVDYVREIESFRPSKKQWIYGNLFLKEMIFEDNGKVLSKNENMPNGFPEKWTKGLVLYDNDQKTASKYIIKEIDDSQYMFFEWKSGDYTFRHQKPSYYVLKKVEDDTKTDSEPNEILIYQVNKSVADFPDNDFSTPESAYAAVNKILGFNDVQKLAAVSLTRLGEGVIKAQLSDNPLSPEWIKTLENAQILEVMILKDKNYAAVIAKLPQEYSSEPIKKPFDLRGFNFENDKWLNHEDGRVRTLEEAKAMLSADMDKTNEKVKKLENRTSSAKRLSELGKKMLTFSNDNNEKYFEKLADLAKADVNETDLTWFDENIVYLGNKVGLTDPPNAVLAYDATLLEQENGEGTNVLYNDLHVAFEKTETLEKLGIKRQAETGSEPNVMQVYEVNKSIADFLDNPGAENGKDDLPSSWFKACVPAEGLKMYRDMENVHSGKYSFAIANTHKYDQTVSNNWAQNIQNVPVGNAIKVSAYIKTENADSVNVCIQCWGLGNTENMLAFTSTNTLSGDNNWGLYESPPVLVPVDTVKITVRAVLTGTGKVWFDDINVTTINTSDENKQSTSFGSNAANFKQKLQEPVTVHIDKSPGSDKLSAQYAVIAICEAVKVPYNWDKSAKLADPQRRNFIQPVNIENKVAGQAIMDLIGPVGLSYSVDESGVYLYKPEKIQAESNFEILDVNFEPIRQGKNVLNLEIKNSSDTEQFLKVHIYTRSVDYGPGGVGWGTGFYEKFDAGQTLNLRYAYKIQGPITENTYIKLSFSQAKSLIHDENREIKTFYEKQYSAKDLPFAPVVVKEWKNEEMAKEVWKVFYAFQKAIKGGDYKKAWNIFSNDYQQSEYQIKGFEAFKQHMEPKHPLDAAFHWDKEILTMLKWSGIDITNSTIKESGGPIMEAKYKDEIWKLKFIHDPSTDTWRIDDITGYKPEILEIQQQDAKNN